MAISRGNSINLSKVHGHKQPWNPDALRKKIQAGVLVNRLHRHVIGELKMETSQVRAAEILLRKCVPDLSTVAHTGPGGGAVEVHQIHLVAVKPTHDFSED